MSKDEVIHARQNEQRTICQTNMGPQTLVGEGLEINCLECRARMPKRHMRRASDLNRARCAVNVRAHIILVDNMSDVTCEACKVVRTRKIPSGFKEWLGDK